RVGGVAGDAGSAELRALDRWSSARGWSHGGGSGSGGDRRRPAYLVTAAVSDRVLGGGAVVGAGGPGWGRAAATRGEPRVGATAPRPVDAAGRGAVLATRAPARPASGLCAGGHRPCAASGRSPVGSVGGRSGGGCGGVDRPG